MQTRGVKSNASCASSSLPHWLTASRMEPLNMSIFALRMTMLFPGVATSTAERTCQDSDDHLQCRVLQATQQAHSSPKAQATKADPGRSVP